MPLQYACTLSGMGSRLQYTCNILPTRQRSRIDEAVLHDQIYSRPGAACQPAHAQVQHVSLPMPSLCQACKRAHEASLSPTYPPGLHGGTDTDIKLTYARALQHMYAKLSL